jgi:hypothetical protein
VSGSPLTLLTDAGPVSQDVAAVTFTQDVAANDPLRTGTYAKTLTFTLSTVEVLSRGPRSRGSLSP